MNTRLATLLSIAAAVYCAPEGDAGATTAPAATPAVPAQPTPVEQLNAQIDLSKIPHPLVTPKEFNITFKKDDLGNKRESFKLALPIPTTEGLISGLSNEKVLAFVLQLLEEAVYKQARVQVADEAKPVTKQDELDINKLTLEFIANIPPKERTGGGIAKEVWDAFSKDYIAIMPGLTGRDAEKIGNAAKLLLAKFQPCKTDKKAITFLKGQLAMWFSNTPNADEFKECFEFLDDKADTLLQADEKALLSNLE